MMKSFSLFAAVCLFSSLLTAQTTTSFHSSGESALAEAQSGSTGIEIQVFAGTASAFLLIGTTTINSDGSITQTLGFGNIPAQDFANDGLSHMSLSVDTSQVPGFQSTSCTGSFTPFFSETCGQGPLGLIQANWTKNRITTSSELEEAHRTIGGSITIDSHLNADTSSADASGSFLGLSFSSIDSGSVSLNRDTTITITQ